QMDDALSEAQEEHAVVERTLAPGLLKPAARIMQEHEVQIRAVAELQAAELAVSGHRDVHDASGRLLLAAVRHPVDLRHLSPGEVHAALNDELRDIGQAIADPHQGQAPGEVGKGHRKYRDLLELPQGFDLPLRVIGGQPFGARGEFRANPAREGTSWKALASMSSSSSSGNS